MPFLENRETGQTNYVAPGSRVPYDGEHYYQGQRLYGGSVIDPPRSELDSKPSKPVGYVPMNERDQIRGRIKSAQLVIEQAKLGTWKPLADVILAADVRPRSSRAARQLTPLEGQLANVLGWMRSHRQSGTVLGVPSIASEFERTFEQDLNQFGQERGDDFLNVVENYRVEFLQHEKVCISERTVTEGRFAQYTHATKPILAATPPPVDERDHSIEKMFRVQSTHLPRRRQTRPLLWIFVALCVLWYAASIGAFGGNLRRSATQIVRTRGLGR